MSPILQPKRDYSTWPTKQEAADRIGVSTKTIENYAKAGTIKQAKWKRPTGGPKVAVFNPEDVNRLSHRMSAAQIIESPGGAPPPASEHEQLAPIAPPSMNGAALIEAVLRTIQKSSETSENLFLTIPEAAVELHLSVPCVRRLIKAANISLVRDAEGQHIRRKDLGAL